MTFVVVSSFNKTESQAIIIIIIIGIHWVLLVKEK